jgi:hypothetical protein
MKVPHGKAHHAPLTMAAVSKLLKRKQIQAPPADYDLYDALLAMQATLVQTHDAIELLTRKLHELDSKLQRVSRHARER